MPDLSPQSASGALNQTLTDCARRGRLRAETSRRSAGFLFKGGYRSPFANAWRWPVSFISGAGLPARVSWTWGGRRDAPRQRPGSGGRPILLFAASPCVHLLSEPQHLVVSCVQLERLRTIIPKILSRSRNASHSDSAPTSTPAGVRFGIAPCG
jgi:hypothetical protein